MVNHIVTFWGKFMKTNVTKIFITDENAMVY